MQAPEAMSLSAIREELHHIGCTDRYIGLVKRELAAMASRVAPDRIPEANWTVFKGHGMLRHRDGALTRKGKLFLELLNRESEMELAA